jgi:hypothetical protein
LSRAAALLLAAAAGGLACAAEPAADPPSPFGPSVRIDLGRDRSPEALASGDFDGDGRIDLVVGSFGSNDVTVLLGDGRGGFRVGRSFAAGPNPTEIFVGDFDRDGYLDLAIANHDATSVTILLGDGRGGFRGGPGSPLVVHSKPHPHTVAGCDADGDGILDLVIDSWGENRLTLLRGDGKGGFRTPGEPIEVGRKPYRNLKAADLDGDGRCDLVSPSYDTGTVTVLYGDGHGGFRAAAPLAAGPAPFTVDVADVDGDGKLDLVFSNYSGQITDPSDDAITFLLGDGKGGFRPGPRLPTGRGPFQVAAGDINGDGAADVATANHGSSDLTISLGGPGGLAASRMARAPLPEKPDRVLLVDVNGDRHADAVVASSEGHAVFVLLAR